MEPDDPVRQIDERILVGAEFDLAIDQRAGCDQAVDEAADGANDTFDQPLVARLIDVAIGREDDRVFNPVEHAADRDEGILDIGRAGVAARAVAP